MLLGLFAAAALFGLYGLILIYHWIRYSMNAGATIIALLSYVSGGVFLLAIMLGAILST